MSALTLDAELAPFGWYPDPAGSPMLRWWNGTNWTDRTEYPRPELQPAFGYSSRDGRITRHFEYA
jgi:hypothetical protein